MSISKYLFSLFLSCFALAAHCQETAGIFGRISSADGTPLPGSSIYIDGKMHGSADSSGSYSIKPLKAGSHQVQISMMGYEPYIRAVMLQKGEMLKADFVLEKEQTSLDEVLVKGTTAVQQTARQSYNVTALDAVKLHNTTLDLSHALDRVSGVRVRENGGVGSSFNVSLNGFTGRQVKFFIDGVPMDNLGSSFQMNNIPINLAERIEVYKGVVPVWLGSDALGGAVNIVTGSKKQNYLDASYSFGSFNTHKTAVNAAYTAKSGFTFRVNAFQNYSDNNYKVTVTETDMYTQQTYQNIKVRRFHDNYHNETVILNAGVVDKSYADQLLIGMTLGKNYAEIQTGARMQSVFGAWHRTGNIVMPSLKYTKRNLFIQGLDLGITANYNLGEEQNIDTLYARYNWLRQVKYYSGEGSERQRSMYKYRNNNGIATTGLTYVLSEKHTFNLNNVFTTFNRKGSDELFPEEASYDQPRRNIKNVTGLGYKFAPNEKFSTSLFTKYLYQQSSYSQSYNPSGSWGDVAYNRLSSTTDKIGYGIASSYYILPQYQLKFSYERSYRLPETDELFGDMINLEGNMDLRPEQSHNLNLGISGQARFGSSHEFTFDANVSYRDAKDFIRPRLNPNETKQLMGNLASVTNLGVDGEVRYSYKRFFNAGFNLTYQNLRNNTKYEDAYTIVSPLYRDRIPNMPYLFGNADASLLFSDVFKAGNTLRVGYNVLYVHAYYLSWPSQGTSSSKREIPRQWNQDINLTYTMGKGKYNIGLECKNIVDNRLYDNFSLQKPGRAFYVKFRYFLNRY